ncbi:MAG: hypothetical protein KJ000_26710 [Pirellulaceae bacterium]|nr:hypothetical protein [Pirellulaceae bacterium]
MEIKPFTRITEKPKHERVRPDFGANGGRYGQCSFACGRRIALALIVLASAVSSASAQPRVELELITEEGAPATIAHQWGAALSDLRLGNLRIRAGRPGDRVEIQQRGSGDSATYLVTGALTARSTLRLPGAEFRLGDKAGLSAWIAKLKEGGETRLNEREAAFGMTPTQLVAVHDALKVPVTFATKGQRSFDVLKRISATLRLSFLADTEARTAMGGDDPVLDELQGLSAGTAIAAVLRPLGLVMVPQKQSGGEVRLWITDVRRSQESWPVGWPSTSSPRETLPELFAFAKNVAIQDTPLDVALEAIGQRVKAPLLFDHNSLVRQRIDPATVNVTLDDGRTYYQRIIGRLLNQAGLTSELRVDDAGTPFLWITTLRRN